ncbi:hypothetical protein [Paenibacillus polymyxa]|uniref:hypothetical protein n=1 Tax=Paenibacillus polymyxa TaxID=1406 RepID=UPI003217BAED
MKISRKERNLLLYSEIIKEYKWLHKLLLKNETLKKENVPEKFHTDFTYVAPVILKQCGQEWKGDENVVNPVVDLGPIERKKCSLCGTPTRYLCYIQNKINGKRINIGRDCAEEFVDLNSLVDGKTKGQLLASAKEVRRFSEINKRIPGLEQTIEMWLHRTEKYDIVLPRKMEVPYNESGEVLRDLYRNYLKGIESEQVFEEIEVRLSSEKSTIEMFEKYQEINRNTPFIATRKMINWLRNRADQKTENILRENGKVTFETVSCIWEREYVDKHISIVKELFLAAGANFLEIDHEIGGYTFQYGRSRVTLYISFKSFFEVFGNYVLGEGDRCPAALTINNIIKLSQIVNEHTMKIQYLDELKFCLRKFGNDIDYEDEDLDSDTVYIWDKQVSKFAKCKLSEIIRLTKGLVMGLPKPTINNIESFVASLAGKRFSREELRDMRDVLSSI